MRSQTPIEPDQAAANVFDQIRAAGAGQRAGEKRRRRSARADTAAATCVAESTPATPTSDTPSSIRPGRTRARLAMAGRERVDSAEGDAKRQHAEEEPDAPRRFEDRQFVRDR